MIERDEQPAADVTARSPRDVVELEALKRISVHMETRDRWSPVASLTELTRQVAHEYEDRFLIELIQNGYDAHPSGRADGLIHIVLDESVGDHGVLYVANGGGPFEKANFDALSNIARTSKPPGQGIGNKGIGFRSVLQVCDSPEIFSVAPDGPHDAFDGYCFGFAEDSDLRRLARDEEEYRVLVEEFSRYLLPVPLMPHDPRLNDMRSQGAVTVVRLPLKSEAALTKAQRQITAVTDSSAPVLLFLDRINQLVIKHVGRDGDTRDVVLSRTQKHIDLRCSNGWSLSEVATGDQSYLVATQRINADDVRKVIQTSISEGQLHSAWAGWDGDAEVSVAVPVDAQDEAVDEERDFLLYTYLPMATPSPLGGHLNAPFYTKLARLDLSEELILNDHFLERAADLCADVVGSLVSYDGPGLEQRGRHVVDLLTWDQDHLDRLTGALQSRGLDVQESRLIPSDADEELHWVPLADVFAWPHEFAFLSAERLARNAGAVLVSPSIGERRLARLDDLHMALRETGLAPEDRELADWLERVADSLARDRASDEEWNQFYQDVASYFKASGSAAALERRRLLVDQDGKVRRTGPWDAKSTLSRDPTVFFPPRLASDTDDLIDDDIAAQEVDLHVPPRLQRAVCFLHEGIELRRREGTTTRRTEVAEFLEGAKLVERFNRPSILAHLRRLLNGRVGEATLKEALQWVYYQHRSARALSGLDQLQLQLPTRGGWISANQAIFSAAWPQTQGRTLERLLQTDGAMSPTLSALQESLILSPDEWPFPVDDTEKWRFFLGELGVRDGLWPISNEGPVLEQDGGRYDAHDVAARFSLPESISLAWAEHVEDLWTPKTPAHPYTPYRGGQQLWFLPGQEAYEDFDDLARRRYASLILATIGQWSDTHFEYRFERRQPRHRSKPDPQLWPSPVRTFVERAAWFPMADPRRREVPYYVTLYDGWHFAEGDGEVAPRFARLCPADQRRYIESDEANTARLTLLGMRTWNSKGSGLARLRECADLMDEGLVSDADAASFRKAYEQAWGDVAVSADEDDLDVRSLPVVASQGRDLVTFHPPSGEENHVARLYIPDEPPGLVDRVLEAAGVPVLLCAPQQGAQIAELLRSRDDLDVRAVSSVEADIRVDGAVLVPGPDLGFPLIDASRWWIAKLVGLALELQSSRFVRVTERVVHDALAWLRRIHMIGARQIDILVEGDR